MRPDEIRFKSKFLLEGGDRTLINKLFITSVKQSTSAIYSLLMKKHEELNSKKGEDDEIDSQLLYTGTELRDLGGKGGYTEAINKGITWRLIETFNDTTKGSRKKRVGLTQEGYDLMKDNEEIIKKILQ